MASILSFVFLILGVVVMVYSELEIISMVHKESDILNENFKKETATISKKFKKVKVQFNRYTSTVGEEVKCMQGVSLSLPQGFLSQDKGFDFFFTSCVNDFPVSEKNNIVFIGVPSVAYVVQNNKAPLFGVFMLNTGSCLQRKYTDDKWTLLAKPEQVHLTREECLEAVDKQTPSPKTEEELAHAAQKHDKLYITAVHGEIPEDYKLDPTKGNAYIQDALTVYEEIYLSPKRECIRLIQLWLNKDKKGDPEERLLDFQTNCYNLDSDLIVSNDKDMININGVAYAYVKEGEAVWAVYLARDGSCVLQIYTDKSWNMIKDASLNFAPLTETQCKQVIEGRNPETSAAAPQNKPSESQPNPSANVDGKSKPSSAGPSQTTTPENQVNPPISGNTIKLIALGDSLGEGFIMDKQGDSNSVNGDLMVNSIVLRHPDKRCVRGVSLFLLLTSDLQEQHLDDFQVTCDGEFKVTSLGDINLVNIADVVYARAATGQEVFAIFVAADGVCLFRRYTDKSWTTLGQKLDVAISSDVCRQVITSGNVGSILPAESNGSEPKPVEEENVFSAPPPNSAGQEKAPSTLDQVINILKKFKSQLGNLIVKLNPFNLLKKS